MMLGRRSAFVALMIVAGYGGTPMPPARAAILLCPERATAGTTGTVPSLDGMFSGADDVTAGDRLGEVMADLRRSGMKPTLIIDHLVGAYCPLVAADGTLSDQQKADRVRQFAQRVTGLAYAPSETDEEDVLVQIPLAPDLLRQIDQVVGRSGLSRDVWIEQAIKRQLTEP